MRHNDPSQPEEYMKAFEQFHASVDDWKQQKLKQLLNKSYNAERMGQEWKEVKEYEVELDQTIRENKAEKHNNLFLWLTVNPKADVELEDFKDVIDKFAKRTMFSDYLYVYEQRGKEETSIGDGFHAHLLLKRNMDYKPSKVIFNSKNTFKRITNVDNFDIFNYRWVSDEFKKDKVQYIIGIKTGEEKDLKQEMDVYFRKYNELEDYYGNIEI